MLPRVMLLGQGDLQIKIKTGTDKGTVWIELN